MNTKNKKGFTLVELIVVIAIIGILAAVLFPTITGYMENAKESAAMQEAEGIKSAYETWLIEKGITPTLEFDDYVVELGVLTSEQAGNATNPDASKRVLNPLAVGQDPASYEKGFSFIAANKKVVEGTFANGNVTLALVKNK